MVEHTRQPQRLLLLRAPASLVLVTGILTSASAQSVICFACYLGLRQDKEQYYLFGLLSGLVGVAVGRWASWEPLGAVCHESGISARIPPHAMIPHTHVHAQVLNYTLRACVSRDDYVEQTTNELHAVVSQLRPNTRYCFAVRAVNSRGRGDYGPEDCVVPRPEPPGRPTLRLNAMSTAADSLAVAWDLDVSPGLAIVHFELQQTDYWTDRDFFTIYTGLHTSAVLKAPLLPATNYSVRVRARNAAGTGLWSAAVNYTTLAAGSCGNVADVAAYKRTKTTMKGDIQHCIVGCIAQGAGCVPPCIHQHVGLSLPCAACWATEGECTVRECIVQCLNPRNEACKKCSQEKCFPQCVQCSGIDLVYYPS